MVRYPIFRVRTIHVKLMALNLAFIIHTVKPNYLYNEYIITMNITT